MTLDDSSVFLRAAAYLSTPVHLLVGVALALAGWLVYNLILHPLARFPGPLSARLGLPGWWQFWHTYNYRYAWALEELHDRYGPVVRINTNHLSFSSPEAAQQIYAHGAGSTFPKTDFYRSFQVYPTQPSLFSEIVPHKHAAFRRAISSAYSMNNLVKLEEYVEPLVHRFMTRLQGKTQIDGGTAMLNMAKWLHFFAMDAVGELAFGSSFGFVEQGDDKLCFLQGVSNLSRWGGMAGWVPSISQPVRKLLKRSTGLPGGEVVGRATEPLLDRRYALLARREAAEKGGFADAEAATLDDRQDMLANFVQCKNPSTGKVLSRTEVLRTAISVVSAGSDTTATALTAFMGYVVRHPDVYAALRREIDGAFDSGALTWPVKYAQAVQLELLQACIKETLRLNPPISMSLPRYVADKQGSMLHIGHASKELDARSSIVVPVGCQVSVSPYVLHRNTSVYGHDARQFNPYRWLNLDEVQRREMEKNNLAFGGGARQCIGKNISLMEINKALPSLLRTFDIRFPDFEPTWQGRDSDGRSGHQVPWKCQSTWFHEITVRLFPY